MPVVLCCLQMGEWESMCTVSGYAGMPSLKIRPKGVSRHGRQYANEAGSRRVLFNIGKVRAAGLEFFFMTQTHQQNSTAVGEATLPG